MQSLKDIGPHSKLLLDASNQSGQERKAAKGEASHFLDELCLEFSELSAPERASIRKQLNQELITFLQAARHMESIDLKGQNQNHHETSISSTAVQGMSLFTEVKFKTDLTKNCQTRNLPSSANSSTTAKFVESN